jgi:hypothetical protein
MYSGCPILESRKAHMPAWLCQIGQFTNPNNLAATVRAVEQNDFLSHHERNPYAHWAREARVTLAEEEYIVPACCCLIALQNKMAI